MGTNRIEQLERLAHLHKEGLLTGQEYAEEKERLRSSTIPRLSNKRWILLALCGLALVALAAALTLRSQVAPEVAGEVNIAAPTGEQALSAIPSVPLQSDVPGLQFVQLERVPQGGNSEVDPYCENYVVEPKTPGGRLTKRKGWIVTGERPLSPFTAVSFLRNLEPGTSGACFPKGGNIGVFSGEQLIGLLYAANENEQSILTIDSPLGPDRVRIIPEVNAPPSADILFERGRISAVSLPKAEPRCNGSVTIPNVFGQTIDRARRVIRSAGWRPKVVQSAEERDQQAIVRGVAFPETVYCSGTGYGLCEFAYSHPLGPELSIGTVGDDMTVNGYAVNCEPGRKGREED